MKIRRTLAIIVILILAPVFIQANETMDEKEIMVTILEDLESTYLQGDISANQKIFDKFLELDVLEGIGYNIKNDLNLEEIDRLSQNEKKYCQLNIYGYDKDKNQITIILSSYFHENTQKGETFLYINYLNKEQFLNINDIIENVESIYNDYKTDMEISTNIVGTIDSKIDIDKENTIEETMKNINANIIDKYRDQNLISYNAYTESIDNHILTEENKMNLNIALRYSESEDKTLIYIGSPIISGGY